MVGSDLGNIGETKRRLESNHQSFLLVDFPRYNCVKIKLLPEGKTLGNTFSYSLFCVQGKILQLTVFSCWAVYLLLERRKWSNSACILQQRAWRLWSLGQSVTTRWPGPTDSLTAGSAASIWQEVSFEMGEALFLKQCCGRGLWIQIREDLLCTLCLLDPDPTL